MGQTADATIRVFSSPGFNEWRDHEQRPARGTDSNSSTMRHHGMPDPDIRGVAHRIVCTAGGTESAPTGSTGGADCSLSRPTASKYTYRFDLLDRNSRSCGLGRS